MKILMVITSHGQLGNAFGRKRKRASGWREFAAPYFVFRDAGVESGLDENFAERRSSRRLIRKAIFRKAKPRL